MTYEERRDAYLAHLKQCSVCNLGWSRCALDCGICFRLGLKQNLYPSIWSFCQSAEGMLQNII